MSRAVSASVSRGDRRREVVTLLNTRWHRRALIAYLVIVLAHMSEHAAQVVQIYVLGWPAPQARGILGLAYPWLVHSEWLHYGYTLAALIGLILLRPGMRGRSSTWWTLALGIQIWHHFEHLLLLLQALTGSYLLGRRVPTSIIQLMVPRVELHLFYNGVVLVPTVIAMILHMWPTAHEHADMRCTCAVRVRVPASV